MILQRSLTVLGILAEFSSLHSQRDWALPYSKWLSLSLSEYSASVPESRKPSMQSAEFTKICQQPVYSPSPSQITATRTFSISLEMVGHPCPHDHLNVLVLAQCTSASLSCPHTWNLKHFLCFHNLSIENRLDYSCCFYSSTCLNSAPKLFWQRDTSQKLTVRKH